MRGSLAFLLNSKPIALNPPHLVARDRIFRCNELQFLLRMSEDLPQDCKCVRQRLGGQHEILIALC